jgi:hypothetical protein
MSDYYVQKVVINSMKAFEKLNAIDKQFVGTSEYMGIYWFWNYEFRHVMRDATPEKRKKVHDAFLSAKLKVDGNSEQHKKIIRKVFPKGGY